MAAPKPQFGASLAYGASPTSVGNLMTFDGHKGEVPKYRTDSQSGTSKTYASGKPDCGQWTFSAQLDKTNINSLEDQYNVAQQWIYTDEDGGKLTCTSACLCDLKLASNNSDDLAVYTGIVNCYALPTYATS